jgi:hypothetical protein
VRLDSCHRQNVHCFAGISCERELYVIFSPDCMRHPEFNQISIGALMSFLADPMACQMYLCNNLENKQTAVDSPQRVGLISAA